MCLAQGPERSDASEARICGLSVSSQALYHWATVLPRFYPGIDIFILCYLLADSTCGLYIGWVLNQIHGS